MIVIQLKILQESSWN